MSDPRDRDRRPADNGAAISQSVQAGGPNGLSVTAAADTVAHDTVPALAAMTPRARWRAVDERRRASRDLDALLRDLYPPEPRRPGTFGLTDDQIRAEFDRLVASGWTPGEVRAVLAVSVPERAR